MPLAHAYRFSWRTLLVPIFAGSFLAFGFAALPVASGVALAQPVSGPCAGAGAGSAACAAAEEAAAARVPSEVSRVTAPPIGDADRTCAPGGGPLEEVKCFFLNIIAEMLLIVASLLGKILVFMTDILIGFASYNGFGDTVVVQKGWIIVRDIVNMFFIIVLLVSAFSSIIGYEESFHYKRVLPKLLLMAILINFSKTLIQLLVDFSQVMMLTFVNAFAAAGAGNFVSALKLDKMLAMAPPQGGGTVGALSQNGTIGIVNIILALMLAVFMLSLALGVVVIMVGYLIFRIVGLWIALILSPIALFATALPGKMQKAVDPFTNKYWTRLTALLTGGPVMAFFLWLTLAITANSVGSGLAPALNFHFSNPTIQTFINSIGNTQDIASFIVGVTLLLMGLDAAVSSAEAVSSTLGGFAKNVRGYSQSLGKMAATSPFLLGYAGAKYADRRLDISGKAATAAAAVTAIPIVSSLVPNRVRKGLTGAMTRNKRLNAAETKELQEGQELLTPSQRAIMAAATPNGPLATDGQKMAYAQQMMERAGKKNAQAIKDEVMPRYVKQKTMEHEQELIEDEKKNGLTGTALAKRVKERMAEDQGLIKNRAAHASEQDVQSRQAFMMAAARKTFEATGNQDGLRSIDDQYMVDPQLSLDMDKMAKKLLSDPAAMKKMSSQAKGNVKLHTALLKAAGATTYDANGVRSGYDRAKLDALLDKADPELRANLEMSTKLTRDSYVPGVAGPGGRPSTGYTDAQMAELIIAKDERGDKQIINAATREAGKVQGVVAGLEHFVSGIPGTGIAFTAGGVLGVQGKGTRVVMSEVAKRAQADFEANNTNLTNIQNMIDKVSAKRAFAVPAAFTAYNGAAETELAAVATWDPGAAVGDPNHRTKQQVEAALTKMETMASKLPADNAGQELQYAAAMARAGAIKTMIQAKQNGLGGPPHGAYHKKYLDLLVKIETEAKRRGTPTVPGSDEEIALDALTQMRAAIEGNKNLADAWRKTTEPEEIA